MTLRLSDEQDRALTLLAHAQGSSKQEAAIRAIVFTAARTLADAQILELATTIIDDLDRTQKRLRKARH